MQNNKNLSRIFIFVFFFVIFLVGAYAAPSAVTDASYKRSERYNIASDAGNISAVAGNVTELVLKGDSVTSSWQGFFGNISGSIELADATGKVMYNWSLWSSNGQVYITTNNSISWPYVSCFNFTSTGNHDSEDGQAGNVSLYGTNLTQIETQYGILSGSADGVNQTFNLKGANTHNAFYVGTVRFDAGLCPSTRIYSDQGKGEDNKFEEVLLYEPRSTSLIFTSLLNPAMLGFDGHAHDFESLVLENGHNGDTTSTPYYFFMELQ